MGVSSWVGVSKKFQRALAMLGVHQIALQSTAAVE